MKKIFSFGISLSILLAACGWAINDQNTMDVALPHTSAPSPIVGEWVNGYTSLTQIVDAYDGRYLGSTWQSGKYFKITENGTNSEFYVLAKSQYSSFATRAKGTIRFDEGSTSESGSFNFLALKAHYKGWGSTKVDRDATPTELKNNLSAKYYYRLENGWLRIQPGGDVNQYSSSFKKVKNQ